MMTIKEYAQDVNKTEEEIIKLCEILGIVLEDYEYDMLDQESITILDNNLDQLSTTEVIPTAEKEVIEELEEKEYFDEKYEEVEERKAKKRVSKSDRKNMYKSKDKLQANVVQQQEYELAADEIIKHENMTVKDLAKELEVNPTEIISFLMKQGIMATINNTLTLEQVELVALEYDKIVVEVNDITEAHFEELEFEDSEENLEERPPIITIMGHVDHGKTTLLDMLRKTNIVDDEAGGITQHIGAYQINYNDHLLTFLDTPGHEAFTQMRARGASVTDIVILVVAADDGVMPQTREAIDHAKAAGVPLLIAVNKIDKPTANVEKIKTDLAAHDIVCEEWGGNYIFTEISAKENMNLDKLLENIILVSELEELKANPNRYAMGTVIETRVDHGRGVVATLLVQNGSLRLSDPIVVGKHYGKVRSMSDDLGHEIVTAIPSQPVEITGLSSLPSAGDKFMAFENEKRAKQISSERAELDRLRNQKVSTPTTLESLFEQIKESEFKELNIVLKADVHGSLEAVKSSIEKMMIQDVKINVVRASVGAISESDVLLASVSKAILIGFNVRPNAVARKKAEEEKVEIRLYNIIYKIIEDLELAMKGLLDPEFEEKVLGQLEVRETYKVSKLGTVAGCFVTDGIVKSSSLIRLIRDGIVVHEGELSSLKRFKDNVKEVKTGYDCGIMINGFNDIKVGDVVEAYEMQQIEVV